MITYLAAAPHPTAGHEIDSLRALLRPLLPPLPPPKELGLRAAAAFESLAALRLDICAVRARFILGAEDGSTAVDSLILDIRR